MIRHCSSGERWAGGTTALEYFVGVAAERWLSRFSSILRHRLAEAVAKFAAETAGDGRPTAT
jgi:hypothetical protein